MLLNCVVLEKTLESPLDCKEIKWVNPKGNEPWIFVGGTDAKAETPIFLPPDAKNWLIGKDPDAGKDWRHEEKGTTEDEMVRCYHWHNGHGFGWTPGVGNGQGGLACCDSWGRKESDTTEWLNWTELKGLIAKFLQIYWTTIYQGNGKDSTEMTCIIALVNQWGGREMVIYMEISETGSLFHTVYKSQLQRDKVLKC